MDGVVHTCSSTGLPVGVSGSLPPTDRMTKRTVRSAPTSYVLKYYLLGTVFVTY